jgi:cardiolipin synthase
MTTANKVTILRILLIPFFVVEILYYIKDGDMPHYYLALLCFGLAAGLDGVDGYIARHFNQRSQLGAVLDPLADKLLLVSAIVILSFDNRPKFETVPLWLIGTLMGRDMMILIGMIVIQMTVGKVKVMPRVLGKIATVFQMSVVLWIMLKWNRKWLLPLSLGAAICTGVSGLLYVWDGVRQLSAHPSSSPESKAN